MNFVSEPHEYIGPEYVVCSSCGKTVSRTFLAHVQNCKVAEKLTISFLFRLTSAWIGVHYSKRDRRFCINLIPCCTIWITKKGGQRP